MLNFKKEAMLQIITTLKNKLDIFIFLAQKIKKFRDNQTFDYHKLHF